MLRYQGFHSAMVDFCVSELREPQRRNRKKCMHTGTCKAYYRTFLTIANPLPTKFYQKVDPYQQ
jgi:hypothetical protein